MISQKGQSLIEALIALGAATLVVSAIAIAVISAVNNADFSKYENLATHYAQQGIEILRQQSQSNWSTFSGLADSCLGDDNVFVPGTQNCPLFQSDNTKPPPNVANFFIRQIRLTPDVVVGSSCQGSVHGIVSVYWNDGKCPKNSYCHKVAIDSCFANINKVTPL